MIKKAYQQECECEEAEVSPREVGHNIYILAQQVTWLLFTPLGPGDSNLFCLSISPGEYPSIRVHYCWD